MCYHPVETVPKWIAFFAVIGLSHLSPWLASQPWHPSQMNFSEEVQAKVLHVFSFENPGLFYL
jgi:hypothetical protein